MENKGSRWGDLRPPYDAVTLLAMIPRHWMYENGGKLAAAVANYLDGNGLDAGEMRQIRTYLRRYMAAPVWDVALINIREPDIEALEGLRAGIDALTSPAKITMWLHRALEVGIDPL